MKKPEVYKKDQKYNIIYSDQDGKDNEFEFTPKEDMTKPKMIMKCKEANKNFIKLKEIKKLEEGVHKMEETKLEEGIFNKKYVINCIIGGTQGYVGNDLEKAEDNLYEKAEDAMIFDSKDEAKKIAIDLELGYNANEVEILPYKKANKIDKKEESFESNKEYSAGTILAIIDNYINSDDIPNLFDRMGITQEIYEGDEEIPEGKIQDIIEIGLQWLFEHLQSEDYKRVLKDDLEMTDEEMEKYGVELDESKKLNENKTLKWTYYEEENDEGKIDKWYSAHLNDYDFSIYDLDDAFVLIVEYVDEDGIIRGDDYAFDTLEEAKEAALDISQKSLDELKKLNENKTLPKAKVFNNQEEAKRFAEKNNINTCDYKNCYGGCVLIWDPTRSENKKESKKIEEADENSFKPEVDDYYFLNNNLIWDERIGDLAIGIGLSQLESIKKTEDLTGVTIDENIKKYLEEHPANLFVVEGQIPDIKVTLIGDQSGNPIKIDNLRVGG